MARLLKPVIPCSMFTVKLRLEPTEQQKSLLNELMGLYVDLCNDYMQFALLNNTCNPNQLFKICYKSLRKKYSTLISNLHSPAYRLVCTTLKSLNIKKKQVINSMNYRKKHGMFISKKFQKHYDRIIVATPKFNKTISVKLTYCDCYGFKLFKNENTGILSILNREVSIVTPSNNGRYRQYIKFSIGEYYRNKIISHAFKFGDAQLVYNKDKDVYWLYVSVYIPKRSTPKTYDVLGVDQGYYNLLYCSDGFYINCGNIWNDINRRFKFISKLQSVADKGSRSAKKHLKHALKRIYRFINDLCHILSKLFLKYALYSNYSNVIFEQLKGIKSKVRYIPKNFRKILHKWPQAKLMNYIQYKLELYSIKVTYVQPKDTSITCSICGYKNKDARISQDAFLCPTHGILNADHNAAINILHKGCEVLCNEYYEKKKHLLNQLFQGCIVNQPIVQETEQAPVLLEQE